MSNKTWIDPLARYLSPPLENPHLTPPPASPEGLSIRQSASSPRKEPRKSSIRFIDLNRSTGPSPSPRVRSLQRVSPIILPVPKRQLSRPVVSESKPALKNQFASETDECYWRLGKALCQISPSHFPRLETTKKMKCSGEQLIHHVQKSMNILKKELGSEVSMTMFNASQQAAASFTGVHRKTVKKVEESLKNKEFSRKKTKKITEMGEKEKNRHLASQLSIYQRAKIIKKIHDTWKSKEVVKSETLWAWSKSELGFQYGLRYFQRVLLGLGLVFRKTTHCSLIEERPDLIKKRVAFLKRKNELDQENAYFGALDETWAHEGMSLPSAYQFKMGTMYQRSRLADPSMPVAGPSKGKNRGKRGIIQAVLTERGILPGSEKFSVSGGDPNSQPEDYHQQMNSDSYGDYIRQIVPALAAEAAVTGRRGVLLIDNAPYHNKARKKAPISTSTKAELQDFLTEQEVAFDCRTKRPELLKMCQDYVKNNGGREAFLEYELDCWAEEVWDVEILRLPPYHCMWNPIEFVWAQLKQHLRQQGKPDDTVHQVQARTVEFLNNFTSDSAQKLFAHTKESETDVRSMMEEKQSMEEDHDFKLLYDIDEHGDMVNIRIDEDDDAFVEDVIVAPIDDDWGNDWY